MSYGDDDRADALDVLIEQERQLIARFEARHTSAQAVATTVITSAFSVAALITAGAQTLPGVDESFAWAAVVVLGVVLVVALLSRFLGGLHARRNGSWDPLRWRVSSRSLTYKQALHDLRASHELPVEARRLVLCVCRARAHDAERAAESKERWAVAASVALAFGLVAAVGLCLYPVVFSPAASH